MRVAIHITTGSRQYEHSHRSVVNRTPRSLTRLVGREPGSEAIPRRTLVASHVMDTVMAPIYRPLHFPFERSLRANAFSRRVYTHPSPRAERAHAILVTSTGPWRST